MYRYLSVVFFLINMSIVSQNNMSRSSVNEIDQKIINKHKFRCNIIDESQGNILNEAIKISHSQKKTSSFLQSRVLRIAILTTPEYSHYFINKANKKNSSISEKKEVVLQAILNTVNTVNTIFSRDLGVKLELIPNNDKLIFLEKNNNNLENNNPVALIHKSVGIIDNIIGADNYDIGHSFSTNIGGLSGLGVVFTKNKAQGTTGAPIPEGEIFNIDYFAHEIGHQLGATHTQNSNCSRNPNSAVEPGSGVSIMGYAGICSVNQSNVENYSEPFFHNLSIEQIKNHLKIVSSRIVADTDNSNIELLPISDYLIPLKTPFEIKLKLKTKENRMLSYTCDQIDNEYAVFPPLETSKKGPSFSSRLPSNNPTISFPPIADVLNNNLSTRKAMLSNVPRNYNFCASVKVNGLSNFAIPFQKFKITVVDNKPFKVISQYKNDIIWNPNETQNIRWNVSKTNEYPINTDFVQISLSINNGKDFEYILAEKTANDGFESIKVPMGISSNKCRIKIKAIDNIFYAINAKTFSITPYQELNYLGDQKQITGKTTISSIFINDEINFNDLEVHVDAEYPEIYRLKISLKNPKQKEVLLWNNHCSSEKYINVHFKDNEQLIPKGEFNRGGKKCESVVSGIRNPENRLSNLGKQTKGLWELKIESLNNDLIGSLNNWRLVFKTKGNKNQNIVFGENKAINIFPNPATTHFFVQLKDQQQSNKVEFFSITGKLIKTYIFKDILIKKIELLDIQAGVYLVKITNGDKVINKKMVIV